MANSRYYSSIAAATNLQVTVTPSDTSIQVASSTGFPNTFPFTLSLDYGSANEELVEATSGGPMIFTVTRAIDGTSATTHNGGAVVRHVSSARDFTDSRTHEASTSGVHGITGSFVDTASAQTISNKTLTSPVINNPTVNGTVSGTPTIVGGPLFNANPPIFERTTDTADTWKVRKAGDTNTRLSALANGTLQWGPGNAAQDTNLYRSAANVLQTDDNFVVLGETRSIRTAASDLSYTATVGGDSVTRFTTKADGTMAWGPGNAAQDTTLSRSSSGTLSTSNITLSGNLTYTGDLISGTAWNTYTPSWQAATTNPTLGLGGSLTGRWRQVGKTVFVNIYVQQGGAGASAGSGAYTLSLPVVSFTGGTFYVGDAQILNSAGTSRFGGQTITTGGSQNVAIYIPEISGGNATGKLVRWDPTTPISFGNGDSVRISLTYEAA